MKFLIAFMLAICPALQHSHGEEAGETTAKPKAKQASEATQKMETLRTKIDEAIKDDAEEDYAGILNEGLKEIGTESVFYGIGLHSGSNGYSFAVGSIENARTAKMNLVSLGMLTSTVTDGNHIMVKQQNRGDIPLVAVIVTPKNVNNVIGSQGYTRVGYSPPDGFLRMHTIGKGTSTRSEARSAMNLTEGARCANWARNLLQLKKNAWTGAGIVNVIEANTFCPASVNSHEMEIVFMLTRPVKAMIGGRLTNMLVEEQRTTNGEEAKRFLE